jgi:hypothetical protein
MGILHSSPGRNGCKNERQRKRKYFHDRILLHMRGNLLIKLKKAE